MEIAGYILAGGKNSRMEGKKKAFLKWQGKTFLAYVQEALKMLSRVYLSVECLEPYPDTMLDLIVDKYPDTGPLGAIVSGLESCEEEALLVVPCDMPLVSSKMVEQLLKCYKETGQAVVAEAGDRIHPLFGIYPKDSLVRIKQQLEAENYRMMNLLNVIPYSALDFSKQKELLCNVNSQQDYWRLLGKK